MTLFELLATDPAAGLTVAEIGRRLGVDKATCYPMLGALHDAGYLVRHPVRRTYHLGPALVPIGRAAASGLPAADVLRSTITELARRLELTCAAIAPADDHVVVVDQAWAPRHAAPTLAVGQRLPLRPPWGAVFVAWADDARVGRWVARARDDRGGAGWPAVLAGVRALGAVVEVDELPPGAVRDRAASLPADASKAELQAFVEQLVEELSRRADPVLAAVVAHRRYPVTAVNVPVFGAGGEVVLALGVMGFPTPVEGTEILGLVAQLQLTAASLGGR
jgi:DNA-binding IclR family transcriptional regulator